MLSSLLPQTLAMPSFNHEILNHRWRNKEHQNNLEFNKLPLFNFFCNLTKGLIHIIKLNQPRAINRLNGK